MRLNENKKRLMFDHLINYNKRKKQNISGMSTSLSYGVDLNAKTKQKKTDETLQIWDFSFGHTVKITVGEFNDLYSTDFEWKFSTLLVQNHNRILSLKIV